MSFEQLCEKRLKGANRDDLAEIIDQIEDDCPVHLQRDLEEEDELNFLEQPKLVRQRAIVFKQFRSDIYLN